MKECIGILLCAIIGVSCRYFEVPLPGPTHWMGVALIASIWAGYAIAGKLF